MALIGRGIINGNFRTRSVFRENSAITNPLDYPATRYVLTKWIHADDAWIGTGSMRTTKYFPIIRYAEILLGYVEAINHLSKSYTVELPAINGGNNAPQSYTVERIPTEIQKYFNPIRNRVGLPGLSDTEAASDETTLDNIIKREYMIEFACENRRYFDVRRWGIYEETEKLVFMECVWEEINILIIRIRFL